jgi:hypothetical protein
MRLLSIRGAIYKSPLSGVTFYPVRIAINLEGRPLLRLGVGGDGETMAIDHLPLEGSFDLQEYGSVSEEDITGKLGANLRKCDIDDVVSLIDARGRVIGASLLRNGLPPFCLWVEDDELRYGNISILLNDRASDIARPSLGGSLL